MLRSSLRWPPTGLAVGLATRRRPDRRTAPPRYGRRAAADSPQPQPRARARRSRHVGPPFALAVQARLGRWEAVGNRKRASATVVAATTPPAPFVAFRTLLVSPANARRHAGFGGGNSPVHRGER